jgi:hypothetical protein
MSLISKTPIYATYNVQISNVQLSSKPLQLPPELSP